MGRKILSRRNESAEFSTVKILHTVPAVIGLWIVLSGGVIGNQIGPVEAAALNGAPQLQQPTGVGNLADVERHRTVLRRYCITCHNAKLKTAGLSLDTLKIEDIPANAATWEKVLSKLRSGAMPPAGRPRPDEPTRSAIASYLEATLDRNAAAKSHAGPPLIHRLNRTEYTNVIRDLLAVEIDSRTLLPADDAGYGFDNIADLLRVSPALLDRYMLAAQKISRLAVGDPAIRPTVETYRAPKALLQDRRMSEDLPFGSRGGLVVRHYFPLDGEYVLKVRLQRIFDGGVIHGLNVGIPEPVEVRLDGVRIKLFTISTELEPDGQAREGARGNSAQRARQEELLRTADAGLEVRFAAKAGMRLVGVAFPDTTAATEGVGPTRMPVGNVSFWSRQNTTGVVGVDNVQISGPYHASGPGDTPSRRRIFVCRPSGAQDETLCVRKILSTLARRAYSRSVTDAALEALLQVYEDARSDGFEAGIQFALEKILVSPDFLFRSERGATAAAPGVAYRLSDFDLASRLSFFLWSSLPDDQLLDLATRGALRQPAVLEQQIQRMVADPRADALVTNFGGQWLYLRNMRAKAPDPRRFPEFDDNLREAFQRETELFLASQIREDRSVLDLLTANYTFVNQRLARHYGIPKVYGDHFRRVTLSDGTRGGLLGQGSILTVTSQPTRTSPVLRGKWILENFLGAPPPPPPPNVPDLEEAGVGGKPASLRERLEQHRKSPACSTCHAQMDPLGFALENFDAIAKWRTTDETKTPIDASGVLPDGTRFEGVAGLRSALLARREQFVGTVTQKLFTYALGRGLEYYDMPAVRAIVRDAAVHDYRWSAIITGIITSTPFQMRLNSLPSQIRSAQP